MGVTVRRGDVFLIPIDDDNNVAGQIVGNPDGELYLAVFEGLMDGRNFDFQEITRRPIMLLCLSLDAKLWHGDWEIIGNYDANLAQIPNLFFQVETLKGTMVESRDLNFSRPAGQEEKSVLRRRKVVAPIRVEKAAKAFYGAVPWDDIYDDLKPDYAYKVSEMFG